MKNLKTFQEFLNENINEGLKVKPIDIKKIKLGDTVYDRDGKSLGTFWAEEDRDSILINTHMGPMPLGIKVAYVKA